MQSSPPQRSWDPPSPTASKYSIDLAAFETNSRSGASTPLPTMQVDKVLSEDIEGPSDFTQNLEMWMNGGSVKTRSLQDHKSSAKETAADAMNDNIFAPITEDDTLEDMKTASHHTPSNSPPRESVFENRHPHEGDDTHVSSDWDPYSESQTPNTNADGHNAFLQPTVEDYYSELTPARLPPKHSRITSHRAEDVPAGKSEAQQQPSPRLPSPALPPEHPTMPERRPSDTHSRTASIIQQLHDLTTRCQQLELVNNTLSQKMDEERRLREQEKAMHKAEMSGASRREQDLTEMKEQAYAHKEDFRREFGELKERLKQYEQQQFTHRKGSNGSKQGHNTLLQALQSQLKQEKKEYEQKVETLEHELELEKQSCQDFKESAGTAREELDEARGEVYNMKKALQQGEELREQIKEQLRVARMEGERLQTAKTVQENVNQELAVEALQNTLKALKQQLDEEQQASLAAKQQLAEEQEALHAAKQQLSEQEEMLLEASQLLAEEQEASKEARQQLVKEQSALEEAKQQLAEEQKAHRRTKYSQPTSTKLSIELDALRTKLNEAKIERDDLQDRLDEATREADTTDAEIDILKRAGEVMNRKFAKTLRKRDDSWRARVANSKAKLLEQEEEMAVLQDLVLELYGRLEIGPPPEGEKQLYWYCDSVEEMERRQKMGPIGHERAKAAIKAGTMSFTPSGGEEERAVVRKERGAVVPREKGAIIPKEKGTRLRQTRDTVDKENFPVEKTVKSCVRSSSKGKGVSWAESVSGGSQVSDLEL